MILLIDNYDSFTYNIAQYVGEANLNIKVVRNDQIKLKDLIQMELSHIILSPGPGHPQKSALSTDIIHHYAHKIPILGICLGHQCIGYAYGAKINKLNIPIHGKTSSIYHEETHLFQNITNPFKAARYHSLVIGQELLPNNLQITAWTNDNVIMACQHKKYKHLQGLQFHPESIWTDQGKKIIHNFLSTKVN